MFGTTNSYMALDAWILANIVQLATDRFCRRFLTPAVDPTDRVAPNLTGRQKPGCQRARPP